MTDATNSKGPAQVQMPAYLASSLDPTATTVSEDPSPSPVSEIKPEDVATLTIEYRDGQPVIVVSGGEAIPSALAVLDQAGNAVGLYKTVPIKAAVSRGKALSLAQGYVTHAHLPPYTPVARILEGGENEVFEDFFD